ncbi:MAG TPA: DNA polymerase IV [Tepidisphaeraceae bacterium]|jgi:DNA polymerase-4|nr:DNA polymerase IV [Tepidisphaeraceae bacterium]
MQATRSILHVDMDAFFASVEQLDNPSLRGKPVLVGYDGPRGVVAAASYEARQFDCHSAQPMSVAKRRCPHAVIVPVRFERYREVSQRMFVLFDEFSPVVEPLSVDEAFLDLTGSEKLLGEAEAVARRLKARVRGELGLTASVGVAPNKFLAKLASDLRKPDGLVVVRAADVDTLLPPMPVTKLWGVGPATAERLRLVGVRTIGDLRNRPADVLDRILGGDADRLLRLAHGIDDRPVVCDREAKSIGQEQTFGVDVEDAEEVRRVLFEQAEQVGRRLRKHALSARSVSLKIRFGDFETITRSTTLKEPIGGTAELWAAASGLFDAWAAQSFRPVRLIGMTAAQLGAGGAQMGLFPDPADEKQKRVDAVADRIAAKFGASAIRRGRGLS